MKILRSSLKKLIKSRVNSFLAYLEEIRGYSDLTIKSYHETLSEAISHMEITKEEKRRHGSHEPYRKIAQQKGRGTTSQMHDAPPVLTIRTDAVSWAKKNPPRLRLPRGMNVLTFHSTVSHEPC